MCYWLLYFFLSVSHLLLHSTHMYIHFPCWTPCSLILSLSPGMTWHIWHRAPAALNHVFPFTRMGGMEGWREKQEGKEGEGCNSTPAFRAVWKPRCSIHGIYLDVVSLNFSCFSVSLSLERCWDFECMHTKVTYKPIHTHANTAIYAHIQYAKFNIKYATL